MHGLFSTGIEVKIAQSLEFYSATAEQGDSNAQFTVAMLNLYGWKTDKDTNTAIIWFTKAANNNDLA